MAKIVENISKKERAILIAVQTSVESEQQLKDFLDELAFLTDTAGAIVVKRYTQKLDVPHSRTFVGKGKIEEIAKFISENEEENKIDMAIFDGELSPSQIRNVESILKVRILDRTNLILDIFANRARTAHAKTQVELAQYQYLLPRLTRMWTHLERQQGGIGMRGPGETELETDRRVIRGKISKLKEQLKDIERQKNLQRQNRNVMPRVALVGYTNAGKSTIMNLLSKSDVYVEDKLFATLDTTVRKVVLNEIPFLLSDTVGFIRKLPHHLIESFKSTLDEVRESDFLLHIVDISHPDFENHISVVRKTLEELGVQEKPTLLIFNKIDKKTESLEFLKEMSVAKENIPNLFIAAKHKINVEEFRNQLLITVKNIFETKYKF